MLERTGQRGLSLVGALSLVLAIILRSTGGLAPCFQLLQRDASPHCSGGMSRSLAGAGSSFPFVFPFLTHLGALFAFRLVPDPTNEKA